MRKPYKSFPLTPRKDGRWQKQIKGRKYYFRGEASQALAEYHQVLVKLQNGFPHADVKEERDTLYSATQEFLEFKERQVENGTLQARTFHDYVANCKMICRVCGDDLLLTDLSRDHMDSIRRDLDDRLSLASVSAEISRVKVFLKWCYSEGCIEQPFRFSQSMRRPSLKAMRRAARHSKRNRLYSPEQIRNVAENANPDLKAMILLGINCGLGNTDCSRLRHHNLDLEDGWLDYPRPKTEVDRKAKLWPETVRALRDSIAFRTTQQETLVFVTRSGNEWVQEDSHRNSITQAFGILARRCGYHDMTFYGLRHTFATIASGCRDQLAVNYVMGHADNSMPAVYREEIAKERLEGVASYVREWMGYLVSIR